MARVTVEDCLENMNRFDLVHAAAKRSIELIKGATPLHKCKNKEVVTALREIADGKIDLIGKQEESESVTKEPAKKEPAKKETKGKMKKK